jgi:nucleotide-binding universal stress UspA family protein
MKKIIVPCDFSGPAINAFHFALDIASQAQGEVHLLHIIELPVLYDSALMPVLAFEEAAFQDLKEKALKEMRHLIKQNRKENIKMIAEVRLGHVQTLINNYVSEKSGDLIIMGTHGAGGLKELVVGSNTEKIVRTASVPVITTKALFHGPVKNIVFPNTLETEDQEDLIQKIKQLQSFFKAHLHLVWVNTPLHFTNDTETRTRLEAFASRFLLKDYTINIFNHANVEEGVLRFAEQNDAQMIAMGTHGRRGLKHLYNGSLAEDIANHARYLVWTSVMREDNVPA